MTTIASVGEHGQGTIVRRADGRLQVAVTMLDGRRVFRYVAKLNDRKLQRRLAEKERQKLVEARERDLEPSTQTTGDFLRSWLAGLRDARNPPRPRTLEHYRYVLESFVIPALGHVRLDRLTPRHVQAWIDTDRGSARSVHHHRAVLRRALNAAKARQLIGENPATLVEMPDVGRFKGSPLSRDEARALLALPSRLAPLWRLAIDSGLRESELLGLAWDDIDLDAGTLTLRNQLYRDAAGWHLVPPKTDRDMAIHLAPSTVAALREHQRQMAAERKPSWRYFGLVFVTPTGEPYQRATILRAFHAACDAAGVPRRRVHDMRGTSMTFLEEENVSEAARMRRAGHVTVRMARHYGQAKALDVAAAEAMERVLGSAADA